MKKLAGRYEFCAVSENEDKNIELTRALIEKYHENTDEKINITAFAKSNTNIRLIEKMLDKKVYLELWVKVKENWRDSDFLVRNFGYKE